MPVQASQSRFVAASQGGNPADDTTSARSMDSYRGGHALAPILIGLSAPAIGLSVFAPELLGGAHVLLNVYLLLLMAFASGVFVVSLVAPGDVVEARFDPKTRSAQFVRAGPLAHKVTTVPFERMERARLHVFYDDDGYAWAQPLITMRNGSEVQLPTDFSEPEIDAINALLASRTSGRFR